MSQSQMFSSLVLQVEITYVPDSCTIVFRILPDSGNPN